MKTENGNIVRYFEALKGDKLALVINGDKGTVNRIAVMDEDIPTASGVKVGTPFSDLYKQSLWQLHQRAIRRQGGGGV
jgi:hypothetical protein